MEVLSSTPDPDVDSQNSNTIQSSSDEPFLSEDITYAKDNEVSYIKRTGIIIFALFGTPLIGATLGWLGEELFSTRNSNSGIGLVAGLVFGVMGCIASAILGPIVSILLRNSTQQYYQLFGYVIPSILTLLYITYLSLFIPWIDG